jgi:hypothetical protein
VADQRQEALDELDERIKHVRRDAEEDGLLPDSHPQPTFFDPDGDGESDGDEGPGNYQIAPPG